MPKISLVVCLRGERDFLERLLEQAANCYDDLAVVHDGPEDCRNTGSARDAGGEKEAGWKSPEKLSLATPDAPPKAIARDYAELLPGSPLPPGYRLVSGPAVPGSIHELVDRYGGRFYEGPRCFQQEPHWPFAWSRAKHDWILRLDADELPSTELRDWLLIFRADESAGAKGYSCIWPLWDGARAKTERWPTGRVFLFNRQNARFIGMVEEIPKIDDALKEVSLVLKHQPARKSFGIRNIMFRSQARRWRSVISKSLIRSPLNLPRWRYESADWPAAWAPVVADPLLEGVYRALKFPLQQFRSMRSHNERFSLGACLNPALHHLMIGFEVWRQRGYPAPRSALRRLAKKALINSAAGPALPMQYRLTTLGGICPWTLDLSQLTKSSKVVSGGVGGDISFELVLRKITGCEIVLLDPSPTGRSTIEKLRPLPGGLRFYPIALAGVRGTKRFARPLDPNEGSFREPRVDDEASFEWPSVTLENFLADQGWPAADLVKLDIEGFEYEVLQSMLTSHIRPKQLLVEFHYGKKEKHSFWEYLGMLSRLRKAGYSLVHKSKTDHLFVRAI